MQTKPLIFLVLAATFFQQGCKTRECVDVSGVWRNNNPNDCIEAERYHVSQDGCDLRIEEEPEARAWVDNTTIHINYPDGWQCIAEIEDFAFYIDNQLIFGECEHDDYSHRNCILYFERGALTDRCESGSLFRRSLKVRKVEGLDILVVVDNSGSMAGEQEMLRQAFPSLLRSLLDPPMDPDTGHRMFEPLTDLQVGVVSTDMGSGGYEIQQCEEPELGDDGVLQRKGRGEGCEEEYPAYLSYSIDPSQAPDHDRIDALAHDFGCIAVIGTDGCGFEQPLAAARKAVGVHSMVGGANEGFLRRDTILAILFVADEDDCSAADPTLFDISSLPYSIDLQCYYQHDKLLDVEEYSWDIAHVRANPDPANLVFGFITGVPYGDPCEALGSDMPACLDEPAMQHVVRPDGEDLEYSCWFPPDCTPPDPPTMGNCDALSFPARRLASLAGIFEDNAVVRSVCTDSFEPAMSAMAGRIRKAIKANKTIRGLDVMKDPDDPTGCRCISPCTVVELLVDDRSCESLDDPLITPYLDIHGDPLSMEGYEGENHSVCEVRQAGAVISDCTKACDDPSVYYEKDPDREGWWYDPSHDVDADTVKDPQIHMDDVQLDDFVWHYFTECCAE